jgi:hypothetical protein
MLAEISSTMAKPSGLFVPIVPVGPRRAQPTQQRPAVDNASRMEQQSGYVQNAEKARRGLEIGG